MKGAKDSRYHPNLFIPRGTNLNSYRALHPIPGLFNGGLFPYLGNRPRLLLLSPWQLRDDFHNNFQASAFTSPDSLWL